LYRFWAVMSLNLACYMNEQRPQKVQLPRLNIEIDTVKFEWKRLKQISWLTLVHLRVQARDCKTKNGEASSSTSSTVTRSATLVSRRPMKFLRP
jgi:hypothetical protein